MKAPTMMNSGREVKPDLVKRTKTDRGMVWAAFYRATKVARNGNDGGTILVRWSYDGENWTDPVGVL